MKDRDIRYLVKFVPELQHAEALVSGILYMRPAKYYQKLEAGQGDISEAAVSHDIQMYMNTRLPIYCMYSVFESDIVDRKTLISKDLIRDFKCESGYAVVIDYQFFSQLLSKVKTNGYQLDAGLVNYHELAFEDTNKLIADGSAQNLFIKHPHFAYQQEYRIVIYKEVYKMHENPIESIEYYFDCNLEQVSKIVNISKLPKSGDDYVLEL